MTAPRAAAIEIIEAGIRRVLPENVMPALVVYHSDNDALSIAGRSFGLSGRRIFVVGGGKANAGMALALEDILGSHRISAGIVTVKYGDTDSYTKKVEVVPAGHPVPDANGVAAVKRMLDLKTAFSIGRNDLVLCLLSGGGSALMPCPVREITLEEKQRLTGLLLSCGATIAEINCVRKHLSATKGGQLGRYYAPATVISLILSDVIGNDLSVIASGPTYPDPSTFAEAVAVLEKYGVRQSAPASAVQRLVQGVEGLVPETPKMLSNCQNFVIGDIRLALSAMKSQAASLGYEPRIVTAEQAGETGAAARALARDITRGAYSGSNALLLGGETTPSLPPDHGRGGRNQHYALVSVLEMSSYGSPWTMASVGTDGSDFLPDIAGAIVDQATLPDLAARGITVEPFLDRYDSYGLLEQTGNSLIRTGNTGTNVGDVALYLLN